MGGSHGCLFFFLCRFSLVVDYVHHWRSAVFLFHLTYYLSECTLRMLLSHYHKQSFVEYALYTVGSYD